MELRGYTVERHGSYTYHFPIQEPPRDPRPSEWLGAYFWPFVDRTDPFGCWPWMVKRDEAGYGLIYIERRKYRAHRISWNITRGTTRDLLVLHKCDYKPCVNPHHLYLGNNEMNMQDAVARGRLHEFFANEHGEFTCYWSRKQEPSVVRRVFRVRRRLRRIPIDNRCEHCTPGC